MLHGHGMSMYLEKVELGSYKTISGSPYLALLFSSIILCHMSPRTRHWQCLFPQIEGLFSFVGSVS